MVKSIKQTCLFIVFLSLTVTTSAKLKITPLKIKLKENKKSYRNYKFNLSDSNNYNYINFNLKNGLASNEIYDSYQDSNGYLWFSTDRGLTRYNGYEFQNFGKEHGIPGNVILDFFPQENGQIWCWTRNTNELFYFNQGKTDFTSYKYNNQLKKLINNPHQIIESLYLDDKGNLHLAGRYIIGEIIINSLGEITKKNKKISSEVKELCFVIKNDKNFYFFDDKKKDCKLKYLLNDNFFDGLRFNDSTFILSNNQKVKVVKDNRKELIISNLRRSPLSLGTVSENEFIVTFINGGATVYDIEGNRKKHFLNNTTVTSFLKDNEGGYWFTTLESGVYYIKRPEIEFVNTESYGIKTLTKNNKEELIIGTSDGRVIKRTISGSLRNLYEFKHRKTSVMVEFDNITNELYYISSSFMKRSLNHKINLETNLGYTLNLSLPENRTLLTSHIGKITKIKDRELKQISLSERCIDVSLFNNHAYIATPNGLFKEVDTTIEKVAHKHLNFRIQDIEKKYNKNKMFLATLGNGIVTYTKDTIKTIREKDGLFSNNIEKLYLEDKNNLWAITDRGINKIKFTKTGYLIEGISLKNINHDSKINDLEIIGDTLWLATNSGLFKSPKNVLDKQYVKTPNLKINQIIVNDSIIVNKPNIELSHNENRITFNIEGLSFKEKLIYTYRLTGLNDTWYSTKNRKITFASLPPGQYTFNASYLNHNQKELQEVLSYSFFIKKPYWKKWWFYLLISTGILLIIIYFFWLKLKNEKSKIKSAIIEQKLLRSQMTPHFIFNSLSILQGMILNKEDKKSISYLSKFSKLLRVILENSRDKTVLLSKELDALKNYISLQNLENENYEFTITVDSSLKEMAIKIPPMLIQPFVENAIEHAFTNLQENRQINIKLIYKERKLICTIIDNGIGIDSFQKKNFHDKKSLSTLITSERIKMLSKDFNMKSSITIEDRRKYNEQGTIVTIYIPYKLC
ncbi:histidine kinase [Tenacibaculum sp. ZS6-P6]|uniref:sensor histidine kinase n=1 Tax=Tenacibaculum sp. ZS6-P6 TaxID=3447503 RepID=UPI003F985BFC